MDMHFRICAALLLMTPAAFATSVDLKTQLQSCQQISDEEQRLSCFDQIVAQLNIRSEAIPVAEPSGNLTTLAPTRVAETTAVTHQAAATTAVETQQSVKDEFGLKKPDPVDELQEISSVVKSTALDKRKKLLITLENGQQWQQIDQGYIRIKAGDRCMVKRGAIGSYLLGVEGITKTIRVRRVE
jgi:hypothetical protein